MTKYSRHVGKKFNEDGSVKKFPGNTVICHVPKDSDQFHFLGEYMKKLQSQSWSHKFSFLPSSSFHMTVFEGICDNYRKRTHWFSSLPLDTPLLETDSYMTKIWADIEKSISFSMNAMRIGIGNGITLRLEPIDSNSNESIRNFRDLLSNKFHLRGPNHKGYGFHISFAYLIEKLSSKEKKEVKNFMKKEVAFIQGNFGVLKTSAPELTFFEDMFKFSPTRI